MTETQFLSTKTSQSDQELIYNKMEIKIGLYAEVNDNRDMKRKCYGNIEEGLGKNLGNTSQGVFCHR